MKSAKGQIQCHGGQQNKMGRSVDAGKGNSRDTPMKK